MSKQSATVVAELLTRLTTLTITNKIRWQTGSLPKQPPLFEALTPKQRVLACYSTQRDKVTITIAATVTLMGEAMREIHSASDRLAKDLGIRTGPHRYADAQLTLYMVSSNGATIDEMTLEDSLRDRGQELFDAIEGTGGEGFEEALALFSK